MSLIASCSGRPRSKNLAAAALLAATTHIGGWPVGIPAEVSDFQKESPVTCRAFGDELGV